MGYILDTNVAIHLRDGHLPTTNKIAALNDAVLISIVTRVELEGGVYRYPADMLRRRARLDVILSAIPALAFDNASASAYASIVTQSGYSRRKLLDRMIAAQALVHNATLITMNPGDFSDIAGLNLQAW